MFDGRRFDNETTLDLCVVRNYVEGMKDVPELLDMLAAPKDNSADKDKIVYEEVSHNFENSII